MAIVLVIRKSFRGKDAGAAAIDDFGEEVFTRITG
jgi:hypothetical protein